MVGELTQGLGAVVQLLALGIAQGAVGEHVLGGGHHRLQRGALGRVSRLRYLSRVRVWGLDLSM